MLHLDLKYISLNNKNRFKIYKNKYKVYNLNCFKCKNLHYKNITMNLVIIQLINQQRVNLNIALKYNHLSINIQVTNMEELVPKFRTKMI